MTLKSEKLPEVLQYHSIQLCIMRVNYILTIYRRVQNYQLTPNGNFDGLKHVMYEVQEQYEEHVVRVLDQTS